MDEEYFVQLSRLLVENFPGGVVDLPVAPFDHRGIQRITILLLAVPLSVVGGETGMELGRALMCLAFATAAIPAYLLARGARLSHGWALATAALTLLVPWSVLTGAFLTESVAYPAALWAVWAAWRACVAPGLRSDLLAIGVVLLAGLARTNLLVLITVAPMAVVLHTWASVGLRRLPRQLWRDHPLFAALIVPGALVVLLNLLGIRPGPLASLSGNYVTSVNLFELDPIPKKWAGQLSRIVIGVGIVPILAGVPWMLRQAFRRTAPELGALALTGLLGFFVVLVSTLYAAPEERYLMLAAPFLLIPGVVALVRGEVPAWAIVLTSVLVAVLLARVPWPFAQDSAKLLVDPAESFVGRVVLTRLPGDGATALGLFALVLGLALAAARTARFRPRAAALTPVLFVVLLAGMQALQTGYVVTKRTELATGPGTLKDWTWVDDAAGDADVAILAEGMAADPGNYGPVWRDLTFFNGGVQYMLSRGPVALQIPRYAEVITTAIDPATGELRATGGEEIPRYTLVPTLFRSVGLVADPVETSTYLPVELVRLSGKPRATYLWEGTASDGWLTKDARTATLRVLPPAREAAASPCLSVTLRGPASATARARYDVTSGDVQRSGVLGQGESTVVTVPLRTGRERLTLRASGATSQDDDRGLSVLVADTRIAACD